MVFNEVGKLFKYCLQHLESINILQLVARIAQEATNLNDAQLYLSEKFSLLSNEYFKVMQQNL